MTALAFKVLILLVPNLQISILSTENFSSWGHPETHWKSTEIHVLQQQLIGNVYMTQI